MKILFIAGQAIKSNSSVTMMNIAYIKGLVENGNYVKVVTSKLPDGHVASDSGFDFPNGLEIEELSISSAFNALSNKKSQSKYKVFANFKKYLRKLYHNFSIYGPQKAWINNVENFSDNKYYDLIISSSDPKHSHLFAKLLIENKRVRYGKWVQLWGDPMYLDITRKSKILDRRFYKEEEKLLSAADKVMYVSPFTAEKQKEIFPNQKEKIDYVLIPYFSIDRSIPCNKKGDDIVFGYFGDYHSKVRNLKPLYSAAIKTESKLIIRGNSDISLKTQDNIDVKNRVPIKELKEIESNTDVFIHLCNLNGTQIPAKVYYYSGTRKPILFILDGDSKAIRNFFTKYDRYIFCENTEEEIIKAINEIKKGNYVANINRVVEEFSPDFIANELLEKLR